MASAPGGETIGAEEDPMISIKFSLGLAIVAVGAGVLATPAGANPPFAGSTYDLLAGGAVIGRAVLGPNGDQPGATLVAGSYVNADCVSGTATLFTAHVDLAGTPINNPAGVINAFPAATPPPGHTGTLTTRFFVRWFPSVSGAPTQPAPTGPPGGGQGASGPGPGDTGSGNFSGRNSPASQTAGGFCSFSLSFVAKKAA
jgi:hypothetical protein